MTTNFRKWIEESKNSGLFIVLDEAHHAPAYGCRHLLIGADESQPGIRHIVKGANLLGLTATPTYSDETRRGWLGKIFEQGVIFQADKKRLTVEGNSCPPELHPEADWKRAIRLRRSLHTARPTA